jgi:valyl-tRNA synthetase
VLWQNRNTLNKVGTSERTKAVIEPRLSDQWFLKMEDLVKPIQSVLVDGDIKLHPARFNNTYAHWLNNIRIGISPSTVVGTTNSGVFLW